MNQQNTHIQATSGNIGTDQNAMRRIAELKESVGPLLLLLLAVQIQNRAVNVVQQLGVVFDRGTAAEEDNDLLLLGLHFSEEGEQQQEALVAFTKDIALLQTIDCAVLLLFVDVDV